MYFTLLTLLPIFTLALALPTTTDNECSTGSIQCCNQVQSVTDPSVISLINSYGAAMPPADSLAGMDCSPITMWGMGEGSSCTAAPVCCTDNSYGSVMSLGCAPMTL